MSALVPYIAVRGSEGLSFYHGPPKYTEVEGFSRDPSRNCKIMTFSRDGALFAWNNGEKVQVISAKTFETLAEIEKPKTTFIEFSPKGSVLATWEAYAATSDNPQGNNNLHLWDVQTSQCLRSFIQKKQTNWQPQWTDDESLCARNVSGEVHFYEDKAFDNPPKKLYLQKLTEFSLAKGPSPPHVACYVPGSKGQPSFVRVFRFPNFDGPSSGVANKSFYKADKVDFLWNKKGSGLLLLTSSDVDKTGASYYGDQALHLLRTDGETSIVKLGKDGPIYSVEWNPSCTEFCAVYGFMPAKATVYNLNCDPIFDLGTGHRNLIYYNIQGTLLILAGFGNLRGNVEVWNVAAKNKVSTLMADDSTMLTWCADGEHFLTATTAPRLRVGNGYRIWHYSGSLLYEKFIEPNQEIWDVQWQPFPEETFKAKPISYTKVEGIQSSQPQASKQVYRPPGARGQPASFKLHDEDETNKDKQGGDFNKSKSALKNQKRREAKKAKKEAQQNEEGSEVISKPPEEIKVVSSYQVESTGDPEKDKKIKNLKKKLDQIATLKEQQKTGKKLEANQLEKIKREQELQVELEALTL